MMAKVGELTASDLTPSRRHSAVMNVVLPAPIDAWKAMSLWSPIRRMNSSAAVSISDRDGMTICLNMMMQRYKNIQLC